MKIYTNIKSKCNCKKCLRNLKVIKIKIKNKKNKYLSKIRKNRCIDFSYVFQGLSFLLSYNDNKLSFISNQKFDFFFVKIINHQNKFKVIK